MRRWAALALLVTVAACHRAPPEQNRAEPTPAASTNLADARRVPPPETGIGSAALPTPELDGVKTAPGRWRFQVSGDGDQAVFGAAREPSEFALRCDRAERRIVFTRAGAAESGATMQVVAADGAATFTATRGADGRWRASDPVTDTFLTDVLANAKGRIGVKIGGGSTLAMPADPVIGQTIRRCAAPRG